MAVAILITIIFFLFLIVRVGAVLLELTGLDEERSHFQALSALTGTGFTTSEAESVVIHPFRRRIISTLMIIGNAGIITMIGSLVASFWQKSSYQMLINLLIIILGISIILRLSRSEKIKDYLRKRIRKRLEKSEQFHRVAIDYLLQQTKGYGVVRVKIPPDSPVVGKSLKELGTTKKSLLILSIERDEQLIPVPGADDTIQAGDILVCFGQMNQVERALCLGGQRCESG